MVMREIECFGIFGWAENQSVEMKLTSSKKCRPCVEDSRENLEKPTTVTVLDERSRPAVVDVSNFLSIENNWRLLSEQVFSSSFSVSPRPCVMKCLRNEVNEDESKLVG